MANLGKIYKASGISRFMLSLDSMKPLCGKEKVNEYRPAKGYRDGLAQGRKNASREISNLFEKHLNVSKKSEKPNKIQDRALEKFNEFLEFYKEGKNEEV